MIRGRVETTGREGPIVYLEPRIHVSLAGVSRDFRTEEATVDTGFTGWLALPADVIRELGLTRYGQRRATQAGGESRMFDIYGALVSWHGRQRSVLAHQTSGNLLIGMALLEGSRLVVDAREGGEVVIEETSPA